MFPIFFILNLALSLVALLAIFAFVTNGTFFGWQFPPRTPGFMELVVILVIVGVVTASIRAGRRASYYAARFSQAEGSALSLLWLGFLAVAVWFAYLAIPEFHYIINNLPDILNGVFG